MLKTRVLIALLILLPVLTILFLLPVWAWQVLVMLVLAVTGWELLRIAGLKLDAPYQAIFAAAVLFLLIYLALLLPVNAQWRIIQATCILWLLAFCWLVAIRFGSSSRKRYLALKIVLSLLYILPAALVICLLREYSPWLVLALLTMVWATDTLAFFTGRALGGPKLATGISPNKTISGLLGGVAASAIVTAIWVISTNQLLWLIWLAIPLSLLSVAGDLLASLMKRHAGRKDSSRLLPGHGGFLDRFDSLLPTAPFFAMVIHYWVLPLSS